MTSLINLPEIQGLAARRNLVRIPPETDVPLTDRVRRIIDTPEFQRLSQISQLGLVQRVYPAANHSRFEHSLGVYRMALLYLRHLAHDERFRALITTADAERLIVAALLHDIGHWPFCHPIEDMTLPTVPTHEQFAATFVTDGQLADVLRQAWNIEPHEVAALLAEQPTDPGSQMLHSILSGPIDVDKMDYLARDSLHAGVPYGKNFDQQRLLGSLCLNEHGDGLAITDKGRTAAEMMVFARYVMFSEVYWHHTVRSATAMLQRAFYALHEQVDLTSLLRMTEHELIARLRQAAENDPAEVLVEGLFGTRRVLYKQVMQFSHFQNARFYDRLARQPYPWLVRCSDALAGVLSEVLGEAVARCDVLLDAPPVRLEVEFDVQIYYPKEDCYRQLEEVSPVVQTLAQKQFDDYVKRVRLFVHPRLRQRLKERDDLPALLEQAIELASDK